MGLLNWTMTHNYILCSVCERSTNIHCGTTTFFKTKPNSNTTKFDNHVWNHDRPTMVVGLCWFWCFKCVWLRVVLLCVHSIPNKTRWFGCLSQKPKHSKSCWAFESDNRPTQSAQHGWIHWVCQGRSSVNCWLCPWTQMINRVVSHCLSLGMNTHCQHSHESVP